jgi:hypothetical protein
MSYSLQFDIFTFFTVSHHNLDPTVCVSHFPRFSSFPEIQILIWVFLIFHVFHCFSSKSRSYSVCFSFSSFVSVSHHTSCPTVWDSHFPHL